MAQPSKLLVAFAAALVSAVVCEVLLRLAFPAPWLYPLDPPEDGMMIEHPLLGYSLRPGKVQQWTRQHWSIRVEINSDGLRDDPLPEARAAMLRVLAIGDSFTFGIGVEHGQAWPEVLERELAAQTGQSASAVNSGVPGHSLRQIRLRAIDLLDAVEPRFVVLGLYARSYWRVRDPYAVYAGAIVSSSELPRLALSASGDLIFTRFRPGALRNLEVWLKGNLQFPARVFDVIAPRLLPRLTIPFEFPDRSVWTESDFQPALDELTQLRDALSARGVPLVILLVNHQEVDGSFAALELRCNALVQRFCEAQDLPCADPLPRFVAAANGQPIFRTPSDIHWTPLAHGIATQALLELLELRGLVDHTAAS